MDRSWGVFGVECAPAELGKVSTSSSNTMDQEQVLTPSPGTLPTEVASPTASVMLNPAQGTVTFDVQPSDTPFSVLAIVVGILAIYAGIRTINLLFSKINHK